MIFAARPEGERRSEPRLDARDEFLVEFRGSRQEKPVLGHGRDLGAGSVRFAAVVPVKRRERLELTLYFPKDFPGVRVVKTAGVVTRAYQPKGALRPRIACRLDAAPAEVGQFMAWLTSRGPQKVQSL
jgi:hypothetical protein